MPRAMAEILEEEILDAVNAIELKHGGGPEVLQAVIEALEQVKVICEMRLADERDD